MQLIAADIGNSSTKIAVGHTAADQRWGMESVFYGDDPIDLDLSGLDASDEPAFWAASSVNQKRQKRLEAWLGEHRPQDRFHAIQEEEVDLKSEVESRKQLGRDRLIAAWMAVELNDRRGSVIVVDAGTAVTIDWVDRQGVFQGGYIFPGTDSNFRQLTCHTDALPDLSREYRFKYLEETNLGWGKSTPTAIIHGVYQAQIGAIKSLVKTLKSHFRHPVAVYATGGGISELRDLESAFPSTLPENWNYVPDLVLQGARTIGIQLMSKIQ